MAKRKPNPENEATENTDVPVEVTPENEATEKQSKFIYVGATDVVEVDGKEYKLINGIEVTLPESSTRFKRLLAKKKIVKK